MKIASRPCATPVRLAGRPALPRFGQEEFTDQPLLGSRYSEAMVLAQRLHKNQIRKNTDVPYIAHLQSVAALVLENGGSENEAIAAWLHDAVEDQGGYKTLQLIREKFGNAVAEIVEGCSDSFTHPEPGLMNRLKTWWQTTRKEKGLLNALLAAFRQSGHALKILITKRKNPFQADRPPWKDRKLTYLKHLEEMPETPLTNSILLVSSSDKLHNARCLLQEYEKTGEALWDKFSGGREGTLWYFDSLLSGYEKRSYANNITRELDRTVQRLKQRIEENLKTQERL